MKSNDGVNIFSKAAYLTIHIFLKKQMHLDSIFQGNHKYFRKKCTTYFSMTKFEISSSLSSSTSLQVFVQQALKSLEERRKREAIFLHHDQTVQMSCLAYITKDISSHVSNQWEHTNFLLWSAKLLDSLSPAVNNSSPGKEALPWMDSTCCHLRFHPEALWFSWGSLFFLNSSPTNQKKKKNREKRKTMH